MRNTILTSCFVVIFLQTQAQKIDDPTLFDFWVGKWDLTWKNQDGTLGKAINTITKKLDGKVIQENFDSPDLKGTSISVFNPQKKEWHQAWADNQGSYFDFEGAVEEGKRIFRTKMVQVNGKQIIQRMVFYDLKPESFTWDWESTADGGKTWNLQWRISYRRI